MIIVGLEGQRLLNTKSAIKYVGSQKLLQRAGAAGWISPAWSGGKGGRNLYDLPDLDNVIERLKQGEKLPLLACEIRVLKKGHRQAGGSL
jgi:hypothetical protein